MKEIELTNPDKIIDNKSKTTKYEIAKYYSDVAPLMLPHIQKRPLSVIRCHENIKRDCFFKKHPSNDRAMVEIFDDQGQEYFYIKDALQLLYQVQMGTVEFHPWASRLPKAEKPDLMIFDLDPGEKLELGKVVQGAIDLKSVLDELSLKSFIKTSGGKGYHIIVPFSDCKDWEVFSNFASSVAQLLESKWPKLYTTNIRKSERKGKIFIDWLRNKRGSTCACAYSLRARENLPLSCPISWNDLEKIAPNEINIKNYKKYIKKNPWKELFSTRQKIK